ncbi:MAG: efflux RND transporter periplasmic adaptor subunit [Deltaproteobacteria bacterium]|nr:efflux RND transporter periplasmic adaptor subunit [Deltaproteobacteria bacterium]
MRLPRGVKIALTVCVLAGICAVLVWAYLVGRKDLAEEKERERPVKTASRVSTTGGETAVTLDRETQARIGIVAVPLKTTRHAGEIKAYGTVLPLQDLAGFMTGYASAKGRLEEAQASLDASRKEYERLKTLHEEDRNVSDRVLEAGEAKWRADLAGVRAAQDALRSLEGIAAQKWGNVIAGWIVAGSPPLERLIRQRDFLVLVTLPSGTSLPSPPKSARVRGPSGDSVRSRFVSSAPATDPRIQGMSFFYLAPGGRTSPLLPGMNVAAFLAVGPKREGTMIPAAAVVWWQGKGWIYLQKGPIRFFRRDIATDTPVGEGWFVTSRFAPGDRLVVTGAQLLLSEEFRSRIQVGD